MPAFGCNSFTIPFARKVLYAPGTGFRLSDRIVSALDAFLGAAVGRLASTTYPGLTRFAYIYPFLGATPWSHAFNLADTGSYAKYALTWVGAVTHSDFGVLGGEANTGAQGGMTSGPQYENWVFKTIGAYSRTNAYGGRVMNSQVSAAGYTWYLGFHIRNSADGKCYFDNVFYHNDAFTFTGGSRISQGVGHSTGLWGMSREHGTLLRVYYGNVQLAYDQKSAGGLGYGDQPGEMIIYFSPYQLSFVFSTKHNCALDYYEYLDFANLVQRFQVGLNRAI